MRLLPRPTISLPPFAVLATFSSSLAVFAAANAAKDPVHPNRLSGTSTSCCFYFVGRRHRPVPAVRHVLFVVPVGRDDKAKTTVAFAPGSFGESSVRRFALRVPGGNVLVHFQSIVDKNHLDGFRAAPPGYDRRQRRRRQAKLRRRAPADAAGGEWARKEGGSSATDLSRQASR
jgi:hypothetical protein